MVGEMKQVYLSCRWNAVASIKGRVREQGNVGKQIIGSRVALSPAKTR